MIAALAASKPFRFIVGPRGPEFMIHSGIVARLSPPLERLVNGPMREAMEGKVKWESIDEDTFICFWQYAYTGNYDEPTVAGADAEENTTVLGNAKSPMNSKERAPEPAELPDKPEPVAAEPEPAEPATEPVSEAGNLWSEFMPTPKKKDKKTKSKFAFMEEAPLSKQEQSWAKLVALRRTSGGPEASHLSEDTDTQTASEAEVQLLCHAKIYVFADCYGIIPLMTLSFNKLHESLVNLNFHAESLAGFVALVQYCYETPVPNDLKEITVLFAACKVERLRNDKKFEDLLDTHAKLGKHVLWGVVDRLD